MIATGLVPRALLDQDAVFVVKRLQQNGHEAYLVGGCVRDLLCGLEPKDFDVATDARPSRIKRLFHSARVIGRRFRLVHVRFPGDHVIETSTFRGDPARIEDEAARDGMEVEEWLERHGAENLFGTAPEDARRRDFPINALFYDPVRDEVIDFVGGLDDLRQRVVRSIGEPGQRLAEDPVRMIRAVHFAHRLGFELEPSLREAIAQNAGRLAEASQARLYVELQKIASRGHARGTLHHLWELRVLHAWIPELAEYLDRPMGWPEQAGGTHEEAMQGEPAGLPAAHATWNMLGAADRWGLAAHAAPESLVMAVLFGPWLLETWEAECAAGRGGPHFPLFAQHVERTFRPVALRMSIPRWVSARLLDVLWMLVAMREMPPARPRRAFFRPGFPEALTLLGLDLDARDAPHDLLEAWTQAADDVGAQVGLSAPAAAREETLDQLPPDGRRRRRGGRGRRRGRGGPEGGESRRPLPLADEADSWEPPPDDGADAGAEEAPQAQQQAAGAGWGAAPAVPPARAPDTSRPQAAPSRAPVAAPGRAAERAPASAPTMAPASPPAKPPVPAPPPAGRPPAAPARPALADDDFAAGLA
ncbi:MAG: hypothetical protein ACKOSS_04500 [Planctomycetia bacterium]